MRYTDRSIEVEKVRATAAELTKASEQLAQVASDMRQHGMTEALFPWRQRQWDCLDAVLRLAKQSAADLPLQIVGKTENPPTVHDLLTEKRRRVVAARNARAAATSPKPRGRPKKSSK